MLQAATRRALLELPAHPAWQWMLENGDKDEESIAQQFSSDSLAECEGKIPLNALRQLVDAYTDVSGNAIARAASSARVLICSGAKLAKVREECNEDNLTMAKDQMFLVAKYKSWLANRTLPVDIVTNMRLAELLEEREKAAGVYD
eukprot:3869069-Amphidinium_carterae.1